MDMEDIPEVVMEDTLVVDTEDAADMEAAVVDMVADVVAMEEEEGGAAMAVVGEVMEVVDAALMLVRLWMLSHKPNLRFEINK